MDKMIIGDDKKVLISNDGATILQQLKVLHPAAKMMQQLSRAQDVEAGDGTTTVVVLAGSILACCENLLSKGIHASVIADAFLHASLEAEKILEGMATPVDLNDRASLIEAAMTSLASKVVSQDSATLGPLAVDAILRIVDPERPNEVDIADRIRVVERVGGTIEDTAIVDGLVFRQGAASAGSAASDSLRRIENAKIGLIQFHLSAPKTDLENQVVVSDYAQMDRVIREERKYILNLCKKIKDTGCNVLLVQKSILRDATNELSLNYLAKFGIMVVTDVERNDVEFISRTLGCMPIAHINSFDSTKLGSAELVEEAGGDEGGSRYVKVTGVPNPGRTVTVLVRGSNKLVLGEAARSLHDALCVVRSIVKRRFMLVGGGAPEAELALRLSQHAATLPGKEQFCVRAFAEALEVVPYTLAENAGLSPLTVVTELRRRHAAGEKTAGIDVKKGSIQDLAGQGVMQPLLVTSSAIALATETVRMILKVDDLVPCI